MFYFIQNKWKNEKYTLFIILYSLCSYMWVQILIITNIYFSVHNSSTVFLFHVSWPLRTGKNNLISLFLDTDERQSGQVFELETHNT